MSLWPCANVNSTIATLNDDKLQNSLKQSHSSCTKSSASQLSELADIKSRLEENNALAKEAASETKAWCSRFDMYVSRSASISNTNALIQYVLEAIWGQCPLIHAKDMVSPEHSVC